MPSWNQTTAPPADERFDSQVDRSSTCHLWTGASRGGRYGVFRVNGRTIYVHRYALERKLGRPIAPGLQACHTRDCTSSLCVREDHLYEGTPKQNMADRDALGHHANGRKTHCPAGHAYAQHGIRLPNGSRQCRLCNARRLRQRRAEARQ
jgi:hypothetical protein